MDIPELVLQKYDIEGAAISPIEIGLTNENFKVETEKRAFVLQKQHPVFNERTIEKIDTVSRHIQKKGMRTQDAVATVDGGLIVKNGEEIWRMLTYIDGNVIERVDDKETVFEAGKIIGKFHRAVEDLDLRVGLERPLHQTEALYKKFLSVDGKIDDPEGRDLADVVKSDLPGLLLSPELRRKVVHGDPKISNIVFSDDHKAIALIDLESCQIHTPLVELGDAFRSWCGLLEDDPDNFFNLEFFELGMSGYEEGAEGFLTSEEQELVPQAIKMITLELTSRFLADYVEDNYFGWDRSKYDSRKENNLARAKGQIAFYKSLSEQLK